MYIKIEDGYILKSQLRHGHVNNYGKHNYCKNNNCIELNSYHSFEFLKFPINNTIKRYILDTCIYDSKLDNVVNWDNYKFIYLGNETIYLDLSCTTDSEYFYNKCINNYCVFNEDPSVTHCDYVHKGFATVQSTYLHCSKTYGDRCNHDYECSSSKCDNKAYGYEYYEPSESTDLRKRIKTLYKCVN
ncbi:hypothetical protein PIROE2DRAFT_13264 [Piromyces sp. E2]|nr:hypothetical protein PIROE2DRAFT_13264 [Piromyces sp. E2]|eukprot:OUM60891.1 hypothetical protein PIROE2DRAFT_13264 [Piromyces sp. E2]